MSVLKKIVIIAGLLAGGLVCPACLSAQTDSTARHRSFEFIKQSDAWLTSENASGLHVLPVKNSSIAEGLFEKKNGDFINYYQSNDSYQWGLQTESFYKINPRVVFYGKVNYTNVTGKNMGGSVFIDPYYNPFDIVEYTDDTRGTKNRESYHLIGAVSATIAKGLNIGGKIDYQTGNYAKHKDARHTNKYLDLTLSLGLSYRLAPCLEAGVNYLYRRSIESVSFKIYGTQDKQYQYLIDYGAFLGRLETLSQTGYTNTNETKPMFNKFNGGALQLDFTLGKSWSLYNETSCKARSGYYGEPGTNSITYTRHHSTIFENKTILSFRKKRQLHLLKASISSEKLENDENVYREENTEGGRKSIVYYDALKTLDRSVLLANAEYTGNLGVADYNPTWVLKTGGNFHQCTQTASKYPYYRKQDVWSMDAYLNAKRNLVRGKNMYSFALGALYGKGGGTPKTDGLYATPSEGQASPKTIDRYLYREYEYLTAERVGANAGVQYFRSFKSLQGYVKLQYEYTKAFNVDYLSGSNFNRWKLTIGCTF